AAASRAGALVRLREGLRTGETAEAQLRRLAASPLLRARRLFLAPLVLWRIWRRHPSLRGRARLRALARVARTWDLQLSLLRRTELIDAGFYRARGADAEVLGMEPALHYLFVGA